MIQDLGDLSKPTKKGEQKRVSICDYKGELRLDIRRWGTGGTMLKGISLSMRTRYADCGTFSTTLTSAICKKKIRSGATNTGTESRYLKSNHTT